MHIILNPQSLNYLTPSFKATLLNIGDLLNATVLDVIKADEVSLILKGARFGPEGTKIVVRTNLPLSVGDNLNLKVVNIGKEIILKALNPLKTEEENALLKKISDHLSGITAHINKKDITILKDFFKNLSGDLNAKISNLIALKEIIPSVDSLSSKLLEQAIRGSGLFFESKIRLYFDAESRINDLISNDMKGLLLKIKDLTKDKGILNLIESSGITRAELMGSVDKFLKIIEFYQYSSFLNNVLYTYLPVDWAKLKEGELVFKKGDNGAYICYISLELEGMGMLGITLTYLNKSLYLTFYSDNEHNLSLIKSKQEELTKRLNNSGLTLKAINFLKKEDIDIDLKNIGEVRLRV